MEDLEKIIASSESIEQFYGRDGVFLVLDVNKQTTI